MNEQSFWATRRKILPRGDYCRIESPITPGYPDVEFCVGGIHGHLELKYRQVPPIRNSTPVFPDAKGLRKNQIAWITNRLWHGGRVFVFAGVGRTTLLIRMTPDLAQRFNTLGIDELLNLGQIRTRSIAEILLS